MTQSAILSVNAVVATCEEGAVSGTLEVAVDSAGGGRVRYAGTDTWLTIGTADGPSPLTWSTVAVLADAIAAETGIDEAGNVVPFGEVVL